ncbi:MAG: hypothetical protein IJM30_04240 [Thermoguttaceae bacterium]|nr:hypothetical protein [Thermoguttaceae bacterium]
MRHILDFLRRAILALKIGGIDESAIVEPNVLADLGEKSLYFEISASDFEARPETERSVAGSRRGSIVVSGALGRGIDRVDAIAQALVDLFSSYNASRFYGWTTRERVYPFVGARRTERVYVVGVERSNGTVADGRYKTRISVLLDVYEE